MKCLDPGHIYLLQQLGCDNPQCLVFVKRSGGAIEYDKEWPGVQVQEVLRVLIDRSEYLDGVIPATETRNAVHWLRMALYEYEARAYRRKRELLNRERPEHDDSAGLDTSRESYADVPFTEFEIELRPIGADGHIILKEPIT